MNQQSQLTAILSTFLLVVLCGNVNAEINNDVYNKAGASIYQLYAIDKDKETMMALGSAVAITSRYLATNCHIALAGNYLIAKVNDTPYLARLCYFNQDQDLCIIDVMGVELKPANIRPTKEMKVGDQVFALARLGVADKLVITQGEVKKITTEAGYVIVESNAKTTFGSSGGGLFDKHSFLIGLTTRGIPDTDIGYSIPTELILEVIDPKKLPKCMLPQ